MTRKEEMQIYKEVSEEQNYECQLQDFNCMGEIARHHVRYGACGRQTYKGNIILLCTYHHNLVHSNKKKWQPILIDKLDKE